MFRSHLAPKIYPSDQGLAPRFSQGIYGSLADGEKKPQKAIEETQLSTSSLNKLSESRKSLTEMLNDGIEAAPLPRTRWRRCLKRFKLGVLTFDQRT